MKKYYANQDNDDTGIDMTPMLDIVFIMLIFFIVTTSFVKESGIDVNRPTAATATTVDKANIIIAIEANGAVWIDKRQIDITSVRANIEQLKVENPEGAVVIQADVDSRSGLVVEVMDQVRLAGIQKISLAADKPR